MRKTRCDREERVTKDRKHKDMSKRAGGEDEGRDKKRREGELSKVNGVRREVNATEREEMRKETGRTEQDSQRMNVQSAVKEKENSKRKNEEPKIIHFSFEVHF